MDTDELIAMANMFVSTCTKQEEKYTTFRATRGWRWCDLEAAYDLVRGLPNYWELIEAYRKEHVCSRCGFPKDAHAVRCQR